MNTNEDGSMTLTKREFAELNKAYQGLFDILTDMPSYIGDFFVDDKETLIAIFRWHEQLQGNTFIKSHYIED